MEKIPAIFCDIDGVVTHKFAIPNCDHFGKKKKKMIFFTFKKIFV